MVENVLLHTFSTPKNLSWLLKIIPLQKSKKNKTRVNCTFCVRELFKNRTPLSLSPP